MHTNRELLEAQLKDLEDKRKGLHSYLSELKTMCDKHNTPEHVCGSDWTSATHNLGYYESEIARMKQELAKDTATGSISKVIPGAGTLLPQNRNQGIGTVLLTSISFVAGALLGSALKSGKSKER